VRLKNLHTASLVVGEVEIQPGAEADVVFVNTALLDAWIAGGLLADVTPAPTPVAPPADPPVTTGKKSDK
jgi:hypothetical protein